MSARLAKRIAWGNWALVVALGIALMVFSVLNRSNPRTDGLAFDGIALIPGLVTPTVGALIATRQPRNPIGWIFCLAGLLLPLSGLSQAYASYTLVTSPGSLPGGDVAAWLSVWLFLPALVLLGPLFFMLFPDGRPSPGFGWLFRGLAIWTSASSKRRSPRCRSRGCWESAAPRGPRATRSRSPS